MNKNTFNLTEDMVVSTEDCKEPYDLDTSPEAYGLHYFSVCEEYVAYLFYGSDSAGFMTDEEIKLCDDFSKQWSAVDTATYCNGELYIDEFDTSPDLSLDGLACRTVGVWFRRVGGDDVEE